MHRSIGLDKLDGGAFSMVNGYLQRQKEDGGRWLAATFPGADDDDGVLFRERK